MPAETHVDPDRIGPDEVVATASGATRPRSLEIDDDVDHARSRASSTTSTPTRSRSSSWSRRSRRSSASGRSGFAIDDDDLADFATVRDVVDVVSGCRLDAPGSRLSMRDAAGADRLAVRRSDVARAGARHTARTARSIPRWSRTSGSSSSATPCSASSSPTTCTGATRSCPRVELAKIRASVVNAEVLAEVAAAIDLGPCAAARQGRGRVGRAGEDLDPLRRDGGGDRRGLPRRRVGRGAAGGARAARGADRRRPPKVRVTATTRACSRSSRRSGSSGCRGTRCATKVPTTPKRFFATVLVGGVARGDGEGRSKKQAEQAAAAAAWAWLRSHDTADAVGTNGLGGHDAGVA